jgi:hypothetical protein
VATRITGTCAICGPVEFPVERISLICYGGANATHCMWRCPTCDTPYKQPIGAQLRRDLGLAGARLLRVRLERPRAGALDLDYMITINDDLEQM